MASLVQINHRIINRTEADRFHLIKQHVGNPKLSKWIEGVYSKVKIETFDSHIWGYITKVILALLGVLQVDWGKKSPDFVACKTKNQEIFYCPLQFYIRSWKDTTSDPSFLDSCLVVVAVCEFAFRDVVRPVALEDLRIVDQSADADLEGERIIVSHTGWSVNILRLELKIILCSNDWLIILKTLMQIRARSVENCGSYVFD